MPLAVHLTVYYRKIDDFLHHADMLSGFLPYPDELLDYVVVACFRKILYRMKHSISESFLKFLGDTAAKSASSTDPFPPFENISLNKKSKEYRKLSRNDIKFFDDILPFMLRVLHENNTTLKFPRLEGALSNHAQSTDPIDFYNEDTYIEYHLLLVELLRLFKESLVDLDNLENTQWHGKQFTDAVWYVTATGDALQAMAGGNIIKIHMKLIAAAHDGPRNAIRDDEMDDDCQPERDHDSELYEINNTFPISQAYCNWLKLMVVHFEAVRILITYMENFQLPKVTIKVLITPNPDNAQLSWKELLGNEKYFQKERLGHPTAKTIIGFIEDSQDAQKLEVPGDSSIANVILELRKFSDCLDSDLDAKWRIDVRNILKLMNRIASCLSSSSEFGLALKVIVKSLKDVGGIPDLAKKRLKIQDIIADLEALKKEALSFSMLNLNLKDLPSGSFKGSIHCELSLACFKMLDTSRDLPKDFKQIADELSVSGIISICLISIHLIHFTI